MRFFNSKPQSVPSPAEALPGRTEPIMTPGIHTILGTPLAGPVAGRHEDRRLRPRLLLGRREGLLAAPRRRHARPSAMPVARPRTRPTARPAPAGPATPRSCWSPTTRRGSPTSGCSRPSGSITTRPRACARATTSAPSTARSSSSRTTSSAAIAEASKAMYQERLSEAGYGEITTEIVDAGAGSTTPRTTTSST